MSETKAFAVMASTGQEVKLAMQRLFLSGKVLPIGARLRVEHVFRSAEAQMLEVVYCFSLPRDAALRRFHVSGEGFEIESELRDREAAGKHYEEGIAQGSLSTLMQMYGDGVVNLNVGNLRPGEEVTVRLEMVAGVELRDDGLRFRFPFTLAPGYHPKARAMVLDDGSGEMELPRDEFGDVILPRFRPDATGLHEIGFELELAGPTPLLETASPSHHLRTRQEGSGVRINLARRADLPNRDLVLDARYAAPATRVFGGAAEDGKRHYAVMIPSAAFGSQQIAPRRVVFLLDRSGSMQGAPIDQARKALNACLALLSPQDHFGLVAFDNRTEQCFEGLAEGTAEQRENSSRWLERIHARGGTELAAGVKAAVALLGGAGGDIAILTDGQVMGTETILKSARTTGVRLHTLGIGGASQDRFLTLLARETGGTGRFVTPSERVDLAAVDWFASIASPVVTGLRVASTGAVVAPQATVFAGVPSVVFVEGGEDLRLEWPSGTLTAPLEGEGDGEMVRLLEGARRITDLESRYLAEEALGNAEARTQSRVAAQLRELSRAYGLASREMSLVAVCKRAGDRSGEIPETRVVAVGMPQDTRFGAYFGTQGALRVGLGVDFCGGTPPSVTMAARMASPVIDFSRSMGKMRSAMAPAPAALDRTTQLAGTQTDILMSLAGQMAPDGGMPGDSDEQRALRSILALLAFSSQGHSKTSGAFRSHVSRLVGFLETLEKLPEKCRTIRDAAITAAAKGTAPAGDWLALAAAKKPNWKELEQAFLARRRFRWGRR